MKRAALHPEPDRRALREWLEFVVATGIEMLDALDAASEDVEDDEREDDREGVYVAGVAA